MERVNCILRHPKFRSLLSRLREQEQNRIFCGHGLDHLLSIARYAALLAADQGIHCDREMLYAAALLHDLGRVVEYDCGLPHEQAGPLLAKPILSDCGFNDEETSEILSAIAQHRSSLQGERSFYGELIARADKESRPCFLCDAASECNWPESKRNHELLR